MFSQAKDTTDKSLQYFVVLWLYSLDLVGTINLNNNNTVIHDGSLTSDTASDKRVWRHRWILISGKSILINFLKV